MHFRDKPQSDSGKRFIEAMERAGLNRKFLIENGIISPQRFSSLMHGGISRVPTSVWVALAGQGIDVTYILSGFGPVEHLKYDEQILVDNYKKLSPEKKTAVGQACSSFAKPLDDEDGAHCA